MATILTITSGLPRLGKSQLALNLALERVRRGCWTGVFTEQSADTTLDQVVRLPPVVLEERRTSLPSQDVLRRGYQGVDILGCRMPLSTWASTDRARLQRCFGLLDIRDGYDELLVDTSGMSGHEALACSLAAGLVVVVVTPDVTSQAQAFAMLRVLLLNGFHDQLRLLVNRVRGAFDAGEIQQAFQRQVHDHLGVNIPMLGFLPEDPSVQLAQQAGQAFSTVFPDAEATGRIVVLADALEELEETDVRPQEVSAYWSRVRELLVRPVRLPGGADLDAVLAADAGPAAG
jgi:flagellar biosynthesis protein FlhG